MAAVAQDNRAFQYIKDANIRLTVYLERTPCLTKQRVSEQWRTVAFRHSPPKTPMTRALARLRHAKR